MMYLNHFIFRHDCCNRWFRTISTRNHLQSGKKMPSKSELNLVGITWPVCLLKFKCALNDLCSCDVLEVIARDPDVVENIIMIVDRSGDTLINQHKEGEIFRLSIEKRA
jgi:TusA-related sulfurtransferase